MNTTELIKNIQNATDLGYLNLRVVIKVQGEKPNTEVVRNVNARFEIDKEGEYLLVLRTTGVGLVVDAFANE